MNVHTVCTTDDPLIILEHHQKKKQMALKYLSCLHSVLMHAMNVDDPATFNKYIDAVAKASGIEVNNFCRLP
jgi:glucuronate isomerase